MPGTLKNAINWVSRPPDHPFTGKPVAILGCSPGTSVTMRRNICGRMIFLDMRPLNKPEVFTAPATCSRTASSRTMRPPSVSAI